jgi:hypothetical protein
LKLGKSVEVKRRNHEAPVRSVTAGASDIEICRSGPVVACPLASHLEVHLEERAFQPGYFETRR